MMEKKQCSNCERTINVKRFPFVKVNGLMQRSDTCRICSRETKKCPMCKQELPRAAFNSNKSRPDGLATRCRDCSKVYERQFRRRTCNTCGTELPKGRRVRRCQACYRELAQRQVAKLPPYGVLFPGLVGLKPPQGWQIADSSCNNPTQTV